MHVVIKSKTNPRNKISNENDDAGQKVQYVDNEKGNKDRAKHTMKHWKKEILVKRTRRENQTRKSKGSSDMVATQHVCGSHQLDRHGQ